MQFCYLWLVKIIQCTVGRYVFVDGSDMRMECKWNGQGLRKSVPECNIFHYKCDTERLTEHPC
jgi:hypothetical protein